MDIPKRLVTLINSGTLRRTPEIFYMADRCGVFLCTKGNARLSFFQRTYDLAPGSLAVFHPFVKVQYDRVSDDLEGYLGDIDLSQALPVVNQVLSVENIESMRSDPVAELSEQNYMEIKDKILYYQNECNRIEKDLFSSKNCRTICVALLTSRNEILILDILKQFLMSKSSSAIRTRHHDLVFQNFMKDLQQNYILHRDTMFYAKRSSLSPKYFTAVIKAVSGTPPSDWIIQTVIAVAQRYLRETTMTVNEISGLLNFPSQAFFCKYFKRYTSMSPTAYRNSLRP